MARQDAKAHGNRPTAGRRHDAGPRAHENPGEAPETPPDEPTPEPVQDPPPEPDEVPYVVDAPGRLR
jgi:hypothetical protein